MDSSLEFSKYDKCKLFLMMLTLIICLRELFCYTCFMRTLRCEHVYCDENLGAPPSLWRSSKAKSLLLLRLVNVIILFSSCSISLPKSSNEVSRPLTFFVVMYCSELVFASRCLVHIQFKWQLSRARLLTDYQHCQYSHLISDDIWVEPGCWLLASV